MEGRKEKNIRYGWTRIVFDGIGVERIQNLNPKKMVENFPILLI